MSKLASRWYGEPGWLKAALPAEWLFKTVAGYRREYLTRHAWKPSVPVIVVGNISVGGTGKTPVIAALVHWAKMKGFLPGIVSRGYGGKSPHYPRLVTASDDPAECGDEPVLLASQCQCPVAIDPDRASAVRLLLRDHAVNLILCDDGLQHYSLGRDIEIAVIDGARGFGNGHCLPVGPLREPVSRLAKVDFCLQNGPSHEHLLNREPWPMEIVAKSLTRLSDAQEYSLDTLKGQPLEAIAGIGNPQRFWNTLNECGFEIAVARTFEDHHAFVQADLERKTPYPLIMTAKDAIKCSQWADENTWQLNIEAQLPDAFFEALASKLCERKT
ncbi:tetraacyldisaccharide 4'-kinase [Pokkaliibacter sp. CJK22405]|uniref:tetraacyldisaccharide 4'-kinase n=1 Tax=Pokkaliibacter sp. CJK22405 TaxID=3384615 RepID=UPI003984A183